ncbi:DNA recombinase [Arthrobacter phage SWEP2]|uniref:DNA recombinase n=1 Tax=Arthrobacter phage SWEP2 TaxID=2945958 RepID=A0A9E7MJ41_9CAUD|nr:DNA recombinase [Arthrobacter phage SWEP2]
MSTPAPRAVLYLRLSVTVDDSTSLARQERDLRDHAARQGWDVVAVLVDEGISGRKARAKAAQAVQMIADGDADVLATWKLDRFTRQGWDGLGTLSAALAARPGALFVALQDGLTSDQAAFRLIAGVLSEVARTEAENTAARARSSIAYRRTASHKYAGGAAVPFGYRSVPAPDGVGRVLVVDDVEAAVVRDVARRILGGTESLASICADLQAQGVYTSKSPARRALRAGDDPAGLDPGRWRASSLRSLFTSDLLLGRVRHHGDLVRDADGLPLSVWPPLVDLATLEALRARLSGPGAPRRGRAARLLSGLAYCGTCDGKLYVTSSGGQAVYKCATSWNNGGAHGTTINAAGLEEYVAGQVLAVAGSWPEYETTTTAATEATDAALAEVEAALRETSAAMLDDGADVAALAARIGALKARRADLRAAPVVKASRSVPTGRTLADAWAADPDVAWRRSVLLWALDHVSVGPATARGRSPIDVRRVEFHWVPDVIDAG